MSCVMLLLSFSISARASDLSEEQAAWKLKNIEKLYEDGAQETRNLSSQQDDIIDVYSLWNPNNVDYRIEVYVRKIGKDSSTESNFELKDAWTVEGAEKTDSLVTVIAPSLTGCTVINRNSTSTPLDTNNKNKTENNLSETAGSICLQMSVFGDSSSTQREKLTTYRFYYTRDEYTLSLIQGVPYYNNVAYSSHNFADRINTEITGGKTKYEYGEEFNIKALPASGYSFMTWDCSNLSSDTSYTLNSTNKVNMNISWSGSGKTHLNTVEMASGGSGKTAQVASGYMPNTNVTLVAHPKPESVNYTVDYYREQINTSTGATTSWSGKESVTKTALVDSTVSSVSKEKDYTGFNKSAAKTTSSGSATTQSLTVKGDGSSLVSWYYLRNTYTVTVSKGTGISSVSGGGTYKYEQKATISATPDSYKHTTYAKSATQYDSPYWNYPNGTVPTSTSSYRKQYKQGYFYYQTYIRDKYHWNSESAGSGTSKTITVTSSDTYTATGDYRYYSQSSTRTNEKDPTYIKTEYAESYPAGNGTYTYGSMTIYKEVKTSDNNGSFSGIDWKNGAIWTINGNSSTWTRCATDSQFYYRVDATPTRRTVYLKRVGTEGFDMNSKHRYKITLNNASGIYLAGKDSPSDSGYKTWAVKDYPGKNESNYLTFDATAYISATENQSTYYRWKS